jgi:putative SOS response-associated peptidase YedK
MCGRYTLTLDPDELQELFGLSEPPPPGLAPRYNIAPSQPVAVVPNRETRKLELFRWGLIPAWAKDPKIGSQMINARSETAAEKPAFRAAFKKRRCLILADGFYEWQRTETRKTPVYFQLEGGRPFAFAGLWEAWASPDQGTVHSCTILTTQANTLVAPTHDRMPVILPPDAYPLWLSPGELAAEQARRLLQPFAPEQMTVRAVSSRVNNPNFDSPECVRPM